MRDEEKTKEQLIFELAEMRQHVIETETRLKQTQARLINSQVKIQHLNSFMTDFTERKLADAKLRTAPTAPGHN
jgi:hypothetical protein